eukprot:gnl/TRDRNA2_/TRDRNA2_198421_c0_seq1.p1 gnl/TRDRNA2_/TRDRNA2_198421_c0~~gnl/TRDRNA2_/TRDRNA2_198421_c0_seq1.p1  ORF type:complete len:296 (-),score=54.72 gnl/TRDRNA2_/TRDRNA2_198421_c0_seq1:232-1119(-)
MLEPCLAMSEPLLQKANAHYAPWHRRVFRQVCVLLGIGVLVCNLNGGGQTLAVREPFIAMARRCMQLAGAQRAPQPALARHARQHAWVPTIQITGKDAMSLRWTHVQHYHYLQPPAAAATDDRQAQAQLLYDGGVESYRKGAYDDAYDCFELALNKTDSFSQLGGDLQMYMALTLDALGKHDAAIDLYQELEETHPVRKIRRQAKNLRFILEAPELEKSEDEKVQISVFDNYDDAPKQFGRGAGTVAKPQAKSLEEQYLKKGDGEPTEAGPNYYVWVAGAAVAVAIAWYSTVVGR